MSIFNKIHDHASAIVELTAAVDTKQVQETAIHPDPCNPTKQHGLIGIDSGTTTNAEQALSSHSINDHADRINTLIWTNSQLAAELENCQEDRKRMMFEHDEVFKRWCKVYDENVTLKANLCEQNKRYVAIAKHFNELTKELAAKSNKIDQPTLNGLTLERWRDLYEKVCKENAELQAKVDNYNENCPPNIEGCNIKHWYDQTQHLRGIFDGLRGRIADIPKPKTK